MRSITMLCLFVSLLSVAVFGCGRGDESLPTVKYEAREFSTPVDNGGEGDTIAQDGVFVGSYSMLQMLLEYSPEDNEFNGAVAYGGYFVPAKNVRIEVWLSNGMKLEPKPVKSLERGTEGILFKAPDVPFESWEARVRYNE